jgi:hypothetical protein
VYADNSGAPLWGGSPLFSGTAAAVSTDLGDPVYGLDPFHNFINISAFLGSGTYWLGLGASNSSYWAPSTSGTIGQWSWIHQLTTQFDYSSGYISSTGYQEYAFNIEGSVPEPSLIVLLGISMMSVAGLRRWWRE